MATSWSNISNWQSVKNLKEWGWKGATKAGIGGLKSAIGIGPEGKFMGFKSIGRAGMVGGVGLLAYQMTGNPLLGIGAGLIASRRFMPGGGFMKALGPLSLGFSAFEGFKNGGIGGAVTETTKSALGWAAWDIGTKAIGTAFRGTALGSIGGGLMKFAMNPWLLAGVAVVAGLGYAAFKGSKALAKLGRESQRQHFTGSMAAFQTEGAYTMRQRALQEIQRSHTNARTILSNEAQLMHVS